ncbi:MAG: ribonuclease HII [Lachnospiraceae bacterium]|nr:ribonuclease HII [Lachnospiraceae bacterium]
MFGRDVCRLERRGIVVEKKIAEIKNELQAACESELPVFVEMYENDARSGVQALVTKAKKAIDALEKEKKRTEAMKKYERQYASSCEYICGIDEVGRGPLAGPVVAGAVILPKDCQILYLNDSKQLSEKKREELYDVIMREAVAVGIGCVPHSRIDEINILQATYEAMRQAIAGLSVRPDLLLNDAVTIPGVDIRQVPIVKGDAKSVSIAAASIVAKVTRDRMMVEYDKTYPAYHFADNKGYGSEVHVEALKKHGAAPIHRKSFIRNFVREAEV